MPGEGLRDLLAADREADPFGPYGERLPPPGPTPPAPEPFVIPPPPWSDNYAGDPHDVNLGLPAKSLKPVPAPRGKDEA